MPPTSPPITSTANPTLQPPNPITAPSEAQSDHTAIPSSDTDDTDSDQSVTRAPPPRLRTRMSSGANIVPGDHPDIGTCDEEFPPDDARAMSPRRSSAEVEKLGEDARRALQMHAQTLQSGLNALAEKIEIVKSDHERLEKQNLALQDYIGGLTRSMSRTDLTGKAKR